MILRPPWARQPQAAVSLNAGHGLAAGLNTLVVASHLTNLVTNTKLAVTGTPTILSGPAGRWFNVDGSNYFSRQNVPFPTVCTYEVVARVPSTSVGGGKLFETVEGGANDRYIEAFSPGTFRNWGANFFPNSTLFSGNDTLLIGRTQHVVATLDGTTISLYVDGVLKGTQSQGSAPYTGYTAPDLRIGRATTGVETYKLSMYSRCLTAAEVKALADNPWQVFRPLPRRIWVPSAATGGTPVTAAGIASAEAFGTASVTARRAIAATGIASAEAFGTATASRISVQAVAVTGIASGEAFGTATVDRASAQAITATGIASAEAFGTATVTRTSAQAITTTSIASAEAFGTTIFTRPGSIAATGIASLEAFGDALFGRASAQSIVATGIVSAQAFGAATFARNGVTPGGGRRTNSLSVSLGLRI